MTASAGLSFVVARYDRDGAIDTTFGSGGVVSTSFANLSAADGIAVQRDGRIVAAGSSDFFNGDSRIAVARYEGEEWCGCD